MDLRHFLPLLPLLALMAVAGCENTPTTKMGVPWWPQGPGNPPESDRAPSATAAQSEQLPSTEALNPQPRTTTARNDQLPTTTQTQEIPPPPATSNAPPAKRFGDLVFLSGQIADDSQNDATVEQQTHAVMKKIDSILATHGLTMANVVQVTVHLTNLNDQSAMDAAYAKHFRGTLPARTVVEVSRLPRDALVEIAVVAGR